MKPLNWVCSFIFGVVSFIVLLFVAAALCVNFWLPKALPHIVKSDSGFRLEMGKSESNIFTCNFNFYDVSIRNGNHFAVPQFLTMDRFTVDFLLYSLFTKKIVLEDLLLDIPQLTHVKNESGISNVEEFLRETLTKERKNSTQPQRKKDIYVRHFSLRIGKVIFMDYATNPVKISEVNLDYALEMNDVSAETLLKKLASDLRSRGGLILMQSLLSSLLNVPDLTEAAQATMKAYGIGKGDGVNKIMDTGKSLLEKIKSLF
jgi:hypothetical protein